MNSPPEGHFLMTILLVVALISSSSENSRTDVLFTLAVETLSLMSTTNNRNNHIINMTVEYSKEQTFNYLCPLNISSTTFILTISGLL